MDATDYAATQASLRQALATHDQDYLKRNYPGAWPWPVSVPLDEAGMPMLVEGDGK